MLQELQLVQEVQFLHNKHFMHIVILQEQQITMVLEVLSQVVLIVGIYIWMVLQITI